MRIPRLLFRFLIWLGVLVASLLVLLWAAPAAAQSTSPRPIAPARPPLLSQPPLSATIPSWDGRSQIPLPVPQAKGGSALKQGLPAKNWNGPRQFQTESNNQRCYTVREYRFQHDHGASDSTTFKDYDACQPANQFHLRAAVPPPAIRIPVPMLRPDSTQHCGFAYGNVCPALTPAGPPIVR